MLRLRTFGSPAVEEEGVAAAGAATQRKPLALLALLATAGERGMSRDQLLAYLWPETDAERAPHRLNQVLYALRRALNAEDLFQGVAKLRLNPDLISSDVGDFLAAHRAGDLEPAVALYTGPFLDGFNLRGAQEFERWMEAERSSLARACDEALEALAAGAVAAGDSRGASNWWRRLAQQDPFNSRAMVHLMHALAASGNRAEALRTAQAYEALMAEELEAAPSPAVVALAQQLRQRPNRPGGSSPPQSAGSLSIAVLPLSLLSPEPQLGHFADGLREELMTQVSRLQDVRVIARTSVEGLRTAGLEARELGHRLEASTILEGSVRQAGNRVRISVNLVNTADGCRIWSETYERVLDDPFALQDELAKVMVEGLNDPLEGLRTED